MTDSLLTAPSVNLQQNINLQHQSPLFTVLPAEIRSLIFTFALTDYEDSTEGYDHKTYWYRPGYKAKRRIATELLRSCKRIFQETWFMPFALAEHSFYLMHYDRAPKHHLTAESMEKYLKTLRDFANVQDGMDIPQIQNIRVFAQLWALEDSKRLKDILGLEGFRPRTITITIRYTDFWNWENNQRLHIDGKWVNDVEFPESVNIIRMEFEMIHRRKKELDIITELAAETWVFRRADGIVFKANREEISTTQWTGSSTWGRARWIRDESRPNEIDYYIRTVTWRPVAPDINPVAEGYRRPNLDLPSDFVQEPLPNMRRWSSVPVSRLSDAGIPDGASAEEVIAALMTFYREQRPRRQAILETRGRLRRTLSDSDDDI